MAFIVDSASRAATWDGPAASFSTTAAALMQQLYDFGNDISADQLSRILN